MRKSRFRISLIAVVALLAAEPRSFADRRSREAPIERKFTTEFMVGLRKMSQYVNADIANTPPPTIMGEAQMSFWDRDLAAFYLLYSKSLMLASTTTMGGGMKFAFLNFRGRGSSWLNRLSIVAIGDFIHFSTEPPVSPKAYDYSGYYLRAGMGANIKIGETGAFIDATLLGTRISGAFIAAPFVGVGFRF